MTYLSDITDYLQDLCEKHKKVLHNTNGKAFIPVPIDDESVSSIVGIKKTYVKIYTVTCSGRGESQIAWEVVIRFLTNLSAKATSADIQTAMNHTQEIMLDFDARIRHQHDEECFFIQRILDPSMTPVGLVDQSAIGWDYAFRFMTEGSTYNASAWNS